MVSLWPCSWSASTGAFDIKELSSIGIIGAADGPTSIYAATRFAPNLLGLYRLLPIHMALVPMIQPPIIRALTTKKERQIRMDADYDAKVSKRC